ncbi:MAG: hypothetical protein NTW10_08475 [Bacteroidetes bacterium]|nr:hypothetical protein [Bacteroidota bacterium]
MKLTLNQKVLDSHLQLFEASCVPMSIELLMKLNGNVKEDYYDLQKGKSSEKFKIEDGYGGEYNGKTIEEVTFTHRYTQGRGSSFPLDDLFKDIKDELDHGRFVLLAFENGYRYDQQGRVIGINYHGCVVYGYSEDGEFLAVTKNHNPTDPTKPTPPHYINNIKERVIKMGGTDILCYK